MTRQVQFYLDTNVVLDVIDRRRRNSNSLHLIDQLRSRGELGSIISIFVLMEAVEQRQESAFMNWLVNSGHSYSEIQSEGGRSRSLSGEECGRCYNEVLAFQRGLGRKVKILCPASDTVWTEAAEFVRARNIGASDALHVAIAHSAGCSVFATSDRGLIRELSSLRLRPGLRPLNCARERKSVDFQRELNSVIRRVRSSRSPWPGRRANEAALKASMMSIKGFFSKFSSA